MKSVQRNLIAMLKEHSFRKHLTIVVGMIAIATVFSVVWSLHINGITLASDDPTCGQQEHTHTEACYDWVALDGTEEIDSTEGTEAVIATETTEAVEATEVAEATESTGTTESAESATTAETEDETAGVSVSTEGTEASESASGDTEDGTEILNDDTEIGTESLSEEGTEDATEGVTEEATESPLPGDTKVVDGVTYVYELVCGLEEHVHTDECYPADTSEDDADSAEETSSSTNSDDVNASASENETDGTDSEESSDNTTEDEVVTSKTTRLMATATDTEDNGTVSTTALSSDPSDYYLANTVQGLPSSGSYIIYTYNTSDGKYYVLEADGSFTACTTISAITEATGDGPYYVESTGTIVYGSTDDGESAFSNAQWTVSQESSDSSAYTISNSSYYLTPTGTSGDVTIGDGFSGNTGYETLSGDFTITYTFINTGDVEESGERFNNYIVEINNGNGVYIDVRSDNYGWLANATDGATLTFGTDSSDWSSWLATMKDGAVCTVTVVRSGNTFSFTCNAAGETFTASVTATDFEGYNANIYLTGEQCTLSNVIYTYTDLSTTAGSNLSASASTLVSSTSGYVTLASNVLASEEITMNRGDIAAVVTDATNGAVTWTAYGTATTFYFASAVTSPDAYYFTDAVTLADAAANQDDSYMVYTEIDGAYYIVSAVDGSLLKCTDLTTGGYSDAQKTLLSESAGVYIWEFDSSSGEPVFKFTSQSGSGTTDFADYWWNLSSDDADSATGSGTYTVYNEDEDDFLAASLDVETQELVQTDSNSYVSSDYTTLTGGYGTVVYKVTADSATTSGGVDYLAFRIYVCNNRNVSSRYIRIMTPIVAAGSDWADADWAISTAAYSVDSSYGIGSMSVEIGQTLTVSVTVSNGCIYIHFYNEDTEQTYIRVITFTDFTDYPMSSQNSSVKIEQIRGNFTVSAASAYESSSNETAANITTTVGTLSDGGLTEISESAKTLDGDFDIVYSFTNISASSALSSDSTEEEITAAVEDNYAIKLTDGTNSIYIQANGGCQVTSNSSGQEETVSATSYTYTTVGDWAEFAALMQSGAECTVRVIRTDNNFTFIMTASGTVDGTDYTSTVVSSVTVSDFTYGSSVTVSLAGENCTISDIVYTNNTSREYSVTDYVRVSEPRSLITLTSASATSYTWSAEITRCYGENLTLIGQIAPDSTTEIEWVSDTTANAAASGTAAKTLSGTTETTLGNSVVATFSLARVRQYTVHFDPTNGNTANYAGAAVNYYASKLSTTTTAAAAGSYALKTFSDVDGNSYVILPTASSPSAYTYDLQGWYDIYNNTYYSADKAGTVVYVTGDTVMYADWVISSSYKSMDGSEDGLLSEDSKLDTSSFITTQVFDYNDLFNLYSTNQTDTVSGTNTYGSATYNRTLNATSHAELWQLAYGKLNNLGTTSFGFLFINNKAGYSGYQTGMSQQGTLSYQINRNGNGYNAGYQQGIVTEIYKAGYDLRTILFDESSSYDASNGTGYYGVNYLGRGDYLFQYDEDTGYYYYDSSKNAAYYYDNRFYLFDYTVKGSGTGTEDDFLPFNYQSATSSTDGEGNTVWTADDAIAQDATNYWFGLNSTIDFYLQDIIGTTGANQTISGDMVFKFSGDDDVWVYLDGILLLDLGGTHDKVYGEINFSTGTVSIVSSDYVNGSSGDTWYDVYVDKDENGIDYIVAGAESAGAVTTYTFEQLLNAYKQVDTSITTTIDQLKSSGSHTLTMYYMERGASQSNLAVYMSVSPMYSLTLTKMDYGTNTELQGAEFTVYSTYDFEDSSNNVEASVMTSLGGSSTSTFTTGSDGTFTIYGLRPNRTYYLVESVAPSGYPLIEEVLKVVVDSSGNATVTVLNSDGTSVGTESYNYSSLENTTDLDGSVWQFMEKGSLTVKVGSARSKGDDYRASLTVTNVYKYELPSAGGAGLFPYERAGIILVLASMLGLVVIALSDFVQRRRMRMNAYKRGYNEEKAGRENRYAGTRDRPRQRNRIYGRDAPASFSDGSQERSRGTGPGTE